jgi:3'-5' exonuclease
MGPAKFQPRFSPEAATQTAFFVLDTESIPDGRLLSLVKYPGENLSPEEAIERARAEARESSRSGSDFLPVTFQIPVAVCVARVAVDFSLMKLTCLDAPQYRTREIVGQFWAGVQKEEKAKLVTFNGRRFDMPLLELAAFRYGCSLRDYWHASRYRYNGSSLDLHEWVTNYGAVKLDGGINLLAKLLGKPGKMEMGGDKVYQLYREGKLQEINDYCMFDTLDTYFVFLRTRVMAGELTLEQEADRVAKAREYLQSKEEELPGLKQYLANWGDWQPWP